MKRNILVLWVVWIAGIAVFAQAEDATFGAVYNLSLIHI